MERIEIDYSCPPILVSTFRVGMTIEDYREYLRRLTRHLHDVDRYISLNDVEADARMSADQRLLQTQWLKENRALMAERSMGTAFVFRSPLFRFVLSMILAVQRFPVAYEISGTREEALRWIRQRLLREGYRVGDIALLRSIG